jgi:hypothetical protein
MITGGHFLGGGNNSVLVQIRPQFPYVQARIPKFAVPRYFFVQSMLRSVMRLIMKFESIIGRGGCVKRCYELCSGLYL